MSYMYYSIWLFKINVIKETGILQKYSNYCKCLISGVQEINELIILNQYHYLTSVTYPYPLLGG